MLTSSGERDRVVQGLMQMSVCMSEPKLVLQEDSNAPLIDAKVPAEVAPGMVVKREA